jgi:predicted MPP superfamily phosphohydrolase
LVLAGDICEIDKYGLLQLFLKDVSERFWRVVYVMGNHEYYNGHISESKYKIQEIIYNILENSRYFFDNIHLLDNNVVTIEDVNFIGATLWTDVNKGNPISKFDIQRGLNDYRLIRITDENRLLTPDDTITLHEASLAFLKDSLIQLKGKKNVVVTHHLPSHQMVMEKYRGSELNPAFVSDLDYIIEKYNPNAWIFGHTHHSVDAKIYRTRMICNPKGYTFLGTDENKTYNPLFTINI